MDDERKTNDGRTTGQESGLISAANALCEKLVLTDHFFLPVMYWQHLHLIKHGDNSFVLYAFYP